MIINKDKSVLNRFDFKGLEFNSPYDFVIYVIDNDLSLKTLNALPSSSLCYIRFLLKEKFNQDFSYKEVQALLDDELRKGFITQYINQENVC